MDFQVVVRDIPLPVLVEKKKMKQVRLKVFPSGVIKLSVPSDTPDEWITAYLKDKTPWIEDKTELFEKTKAIEKEEHFVSGASTRILGHQLTIMVQNSNRKQVMEEDGVLHVYTTESDQILIDRQVNNWWQHAARRYFQEVVKQLYPIIEKHGVDLPAVCVKKMSTLWGSCSRTKHTINLNFYLYKASVPCIEYVILHEMAHFLYPFHNREFYEFLTIHMPDWEARKRQLDYEFVLGI